MKHEHFSEPRTIREALERRGRLIVDSMFIERQLADEVRIDRDGRVLEEDEYARWRGQAHTSLVFKKSEMIYLKSWIVERRRVIQAEKSGVFNANDPRELLVQARNTLLDTRAGNTGGVGAMIDIITQYLAHIA